MKYLILLLLVVYSTLTYGQDSAKYWHNMFDSAATRYTQAKIALFNIQDKLNKIQARPKDFVYVSSWMGRMQDDLNKFYTADKVTRPVLVHKKKTVTKKKK